MSDQSKPKKKIAFLHYHLKPGGVTTVLKQQIEVMKDDCLILMLSGESPDGPFPADVTVVPGLAYDHALTAGHTPETIAASIIQALKTRFGGLCDLLHVHNPTLKKNSRLLPALEILQKKGIPLFLQIHDFAEDGRPQAYYHGEYLKNCHYGVINRRDYHILINSGLDKEGLFFLPNIVKAGPNVPSTRFLHTLSPYVLYPVRAVRRKNIGEAVLLSLFFQHQETLLITLPPNSPADRIVHSGWKRFVQEKKLPVMFDAGLHYDFDQLVDCAEYMITTSVTEGFGFSFLEPWPAGKMLWGRKLPDICRDFEEQGICFDGLYEQFLIPFEWIDKNRFSAKWSQALKKGCSAFKWNMDQQKIDAALKQIRQSSHIDFSMLDESFQKIVISRVLTNRQDKEELIRLNPLTARPPGDRDDLRLIRNNRDRILTHYNKTHYRDHLHTAYRHVLSRPIDQQIDKKRLLSQLFDPDRLSLLKWGEVES